MAKKIFPLSKVYRLLEPSPVVMVSTAWKGRANVMAMSWHTMIDFDPPIVGCVISDCSHTFNVLKKTGQCVLNIPTVELASKVLRCGGVSGLKTDKFKQAGLTPVAASYVKAPLVGECYANLECKVIDSSLKTRYNLFILQVLKAWVDPSKKNPRTIHHLGGGRFSVDGRTIHPSCGPR